MVWWFWMENHLCSFCLEFEGLLGFVAEGKFGLLVGLLKNFAGIG